MESLLALAAGGAGSAREKGLELRAAGVGAAGFILWPEGVLLGSPNIAWSDVPLKRLVSERLGVPAFVDNDANAAAAGEGLLGAASDASDFVCLTLGTGIGGGICVGGRIYRGHKGTAAEVGHMALDPDGPVCNCGERGCLEVLASGTALEREAVRLARVDHGSLLHETSRSRPEEITGETVATAAERGDRAALGAFENISFYLGLGIVNLIHLLDPELVVLAGGMARSGHLFVDDVRRVVSERGVGMLTEGVRIELSTLGEDAGVIGAAAIAWEMLERGEG